MSRPFIAVLVLALVAGCAPSGSKAELVRGPRATASTTTTTADLFPTVTPTTEEAITPATLSAPTPGGATTLGCGKERWDVKTGADPAAATVNLAKVSDITIEALDALPSDLPAAREAPVETTVYRLTDITITVDKLEADSDIHMVLDDGKGRQAIGEIPNPTCVAKTSPFYDAIVQARAAFDARFAEREQFAVINATATLTGVGFFDKPHGQRGAGANAVELHPVLSITFGP